jgi:hypothetical protein
MIGNNHTNQLKLLIYISSIKDAAKLKTLRQKVKKVKKIKNTF